MPIENNKIPAAFQPQPNEVYMQLVTEILRTNDERTFYKLYTFISPSLYSVCLKFTKNNHDAEDVFQIAMANLYFKLETYNNTGSFIGWARKLVTNNCIDFLRKRERGGFIELQGEESEMPMAASADGQHDIIDILKKMPANYRIHINLFYIEGYKQAEIAEMLGTTKAAVKATTHRAKICFDKYYVLPGGIG